MEPTRINKDNTTIYLVDLLYN